MNKVVFLFLLSPLFLAAQINESDTLSFKADLSLSGIWQDGNVQTYILRAKSGITYKPWKKWVFKTQNSYVYQAFGGQKADEDVLSLNFLYFDPERKVYPLLLGFVSTNLGIGLMRSQNLNDARCYFWKSLQQQFSLRAVAALLLSFAPAKIVERF